MKGRKISSPLIALLIRNSTSMGNARRPLRVVFHHPLTPLRHDEFMCLSKYLRWKDSKLRVGERGGRDGTFRPDLTASASSMGGAALIPLIAS